MRAIRTRYNGILFRSKLEAQWAKFFDSLRIPWIYEPEGFLFSDRTMYLPDFYLPDSKQWFEVKGVMDDIDKHKIEMLCRESGHDVVVGYANGEFDMCNLGAWHDYDEDVIDFTWYSKRDTYINRCSNCGKYSFMNAIGSYRCQCCGEHDGDHYTYWIACGDGSTYNELSKSDWIQRATIDVRNGGY